MSVTTHVLSRFSGASLLAIGLLAAANAKADTTVDKADAGAIVVTGAHDTTGLDLSSRETPQSVTVLDSERLQEQGIFDISEAMEQIVGIQANRSSALGTDGTNYVARGFAIENYLVDGVARPSNLYGFTEDTADLVAYERLEVIRGSSGLLTGTGQPSAAINMIRKRPGTELSGTAAATLGSWDLHRVEGDLGGPLTASGNLRARVAGAWQENDTFIDREHAERQALYGVIEADLAASTKLTAGVEYQNFTNKGASRGGVPLFYTDGTETRFARSTNTGAKWSNFNRKSVNLFASLVQEFTPDWRLQIDGEHKSGSYDETIGYFFGQSIDRQTGEGGNFYATRWASDLKLDAVYANLQGGFEALGQKQHIALTASHARFKDKGANYPGWWDGAAYMRPINAFDVFADGDVPKPDLEAVGGFTGNRVETTALAGVARLKPIEPLSLIAGGRVTWWKQDTYAEDAAGSGVWTPTMREKGAFTPYGGIVLDFSRTISAYASYASVFDPQTKRTVDGDILPPLEGNTYELGLKADFLGGRLSASAAVFRMKQDNYGEADGPGIFAPDGSAAYHAISGLKSTGFELEVKGEVLPGWRVAGGFANATAKDRDGARQFVQIPRNSFKMFTTYRLPGKLDALTLGGNLRWQSKSRAQDEGPNGAIYTQDSLAIVDLMAIYNLSDRFSLSAHLDNLFDKTYYSGLFVASSRYGTPRSVNFTLRGKL